MHDGAENVTDAQLLVPAVAVPIVGALAMRGHIPCLEYPCACSAVQIPDAEAVVGAVGFLVIIPPGYCLLIYAPTFVEGNEGVPRGALYQTIRTAPTEPPDAEPAR